MCGIAALIHKGRPITHSDREVMQSVLHGIAHRGPDGQGLWCDEHVALAHRRLSIIDLSAAGAQPFHDQQGKLHITFNGEIYNYRELKSELQSCGYQFLTQTDTEVMLAAYQHWGNEFIKKLRGMFAFVLYDSRGSKVILCRDRLGKKPLYYVKQKDRFFVCSEIKAFHAFHDMDLTIDAESIRAFFSLQYIPGPNTIYREVRRLGPGEFIELDLRSWECTETRYWSIMDQQGCLDITRDWKELIDERLSTSVKYRLIADVEVGILLSGGVDSSLISCYAAAQMEKGRRAFVVSFNRADLDETPYARKVAHGLDMEIVEVRGENVDADLFRKVVYHADEPLGDAACIPTFMIAREIAKHVKVVLSGEGADELFWGYPHYRHEMLYDKLHHIRRMLPARSLARLFGRAESGPKMPSSLSRIQKVLLSQEGAGTARWTTVFGDQALRELLVDEASQEASAPRFELQFERVFKALSHARNHMDALMAIDLAFWLPDDLLMKVDRMTMAHSVEARVPFLDHAVVECALAMPARYKADGRGTKKVLRQLLAEHLPTSLRNEIASRKKHGFEVPVTEWLQGPLFELAEERFSDHVLKDTEFMNRTVVSRLWSNFKTHGGSKSFARKLWLLLCFQTWLMHHKNKFGFR